MQHHGLNWLIKLSAFHNKLYDILQSSFTLTHTGASVMSLT